MDWRVLLVLLLCWFPVTADYICVCSNHVGARIFGTADIHTEPIGILYPDVGECKPAYNDSSHPNFVAIVHFHQIGYVVLDKDIKVISCAGHPYTEDLITSPPPRITPMRTHTLSSLPHQTVSTTVSSQTHHVHSLPQTLPALTYPPSSTATHTTSASVHLPSNILPSQSHQVINSQTQTSAASTQPSSHMPTHIATTWTHSNSHMPTHTATAPTHLAKHTTTVPKSPSSHMTMHTAMPPIQTTSRGCNKLALFMDIALGKNVGTAQSSHCLGSAHYDADAVVSAFCGAPEPSMWLKGRQVVDFANVIPKYSPIGTFDINNVYMRSAGIYLGHINSSFFIASQTCHTNLDIHEIKANSSPDISDYYEISW